MRSFARAVAAATLTCALADYGHAQAARSAEVSLLAGLMQFDLAGVGSAAMITGRVTLPVRPAVAIAYGLSAARADSTVGGEPFSVVALDLDVRITLVVGSFSPVLGAGVGATAVRSRTGADAEEAVSALTGVRWTLSPRWALHGELRLRSVDPFHGSTAEWAIGMSLRL